jgi:hypothetical protein
MRAVLCNSGEQLGLEMQFIQTNCKTSILQLEIAVAHGHILFIANALLSTTMRGSEAGTVLTVAL